jgi:hypothetical protein
VNRAPGVCGEHLLRVRTDEEEGGNHDALAHHVDGDLCADQSVWHNVEREAKTARDEEHGCRHYGAVQLL